MINDHEYLKACGLPEALADLWACECCFGPDGEAVFHVDTLAAVLQTNDHHVGRGRHPGYVLFAICRTVEAAHAACDRMRRKQQVLRDLQSREERLDPETTDRPSGHVVERDRDHRDRIVAAVGDFQRQYLSACKYRSRTEFPST